MKVKNIGMSLIVPFYNEEEVIDLFCDKIDEYVADLEYPIEIVFVNDGSTDKTVEIIGSHIFQNIASVMIVSLSKNFGSHAAIRAGLVKATFDICTWFGCDLQEPLEIIPMSYEKITKDNYDAVYVEKRTIEVGKVERFFSKFYSKIMQRYAVKNYSLNGTSTIVFNSKIKSYLNENIESNSSIMLQILDAGFRYYSMAMDYGERAKGVSKWTFSKKVKLFVDSVVAFSYAPIRMVSIIGAILFFIGLFIGGGAILNRLFNPNVPLGYSTLVCVLVMGFGITNISLGILAEYLWRTLDAARQRPVYIISDEIIVKSMDINKN